MSGEERRQKGGLGKLALHAGLLLAVADVEPSLDGLKGALRREVDQDPLDAMFKFATGAAWLFYQAEHGTNPRVNTYLDALAYISTSLSVGYHEIHPHTQAGQAIAAVVHMLGPSLAAGALERSEPVAAPTNDAVVERLDAVLAELRALRLGGARGEEPTT